MELIIQLVAGAIGGNAAGAVLKNQSMGPLLNSVVGILGGGLGGQILGMLGGAGMGDAAAAASGLDLGTILSSLATGGVGGGALMAIIGTLKPMLMKK